MAEGSTLSETGDWDDVEASVIVGAMAIEAAIESRSDDGPMRRVFKLRLIQGRPATLTASRATPPPTDELAGEPPVAITLQAVVGRFGDHERERRLLQAVAARLEDLRGVEFAPIR